MFEVLNDPAGKEVREPRLLKLLKKLWLALVIFEVLNEFAGKEVREP